MTTLEIAPPRGVADATLALSDTLLRRPSGVFCDIDGTLGPLVTTPRQARVLAGCRLALERLRKNVDLLCILTGRAADEAWRMVGIDDAIYVGDHGAESWVRGELLRSPGAERYDARLGRAAALVRGGLAAVPGVTLEHKGAAIAIHYRERPDAELVVRRVAERIARRHGLQMALRSAHVEIRAPVSADKGTTVLDLAERYSLRGLVVIGDDPVDLPAFEAARDHARRSGARLVTVSVGPRAPDADVSVDGPPDVGRLLLSVAAALRA